MLRADYTTELFEYIKGGVEEGDVLNRGLIEAIIHGVEIDLGIKGLTPYNVRQILRESKDILEGFTEEETVAKIIKKTYDVPFIKTFKTIKEKDYIKKSRLLGSTTDFLEGLQVYLENYKPKPAKNLILDGNSSREYGTSSVIALTDLHIGKQGTDLIVDRLRIIAQDIVDSNKSHVDIFCVGDLVETLVQGGMHDGQIETMGDTYGFELLMNTVSIFEDFLMSIQQEGISITFYGLSGNHDRMTKDREGDKSRLGGLVIYELIRRGLQNIEGIDIDIVQDYIKTVDIGDIRYIVAHGDMARIPKRKGSDIAWTHGDNTKSHNVILYGHLHNVSITEEKSITRIGLPGLAGTDQYATKELDLHSEPAYVEILHNQYGTVDINIKRLKQG